MTTKTITINISKEALAKLESYGFDFEANTTEMIRNVYFEICRCEKTQRENAE